MLNSILIILLILNLLLNNLKIIGGLFGIILILNISYNKNLLSRIKKLKILIYIYILTFFMYVFSQQEGEIIWKIGGIYLTKEAIENFSLNFLRIINFIMISWLIKGDNIIFNKFSGYKDVIEKVIQLVPEVFVLFRKRLKIKSFLRHILTSIRIEKN